MPHAARLTLGEISEALEASGGIHGVAAERLGVSRQTLARRIKDEPFLQLSEYDIHETLKDVAEATVYRAILGGATARFCMRFLTQRAVERGYGTGRKRRIFEKMEFDKNFEVMIARWNLSIEERDALALASVDEPLDESRSEEAVPEK